jgi:hypothetical protein
MSFGVDELASLLAATVLEYSIVTTFFVIYSASYRQVVREMTSYIVYNVIPVAGVSGVSAAVGASAETVSTQVYH